MQFGLTNNGSRVQAQSTQQNRRCIYLQVQLLGYYNIF